MIEKETLFSNVETVNSKQIAVLKKHFPQCFDKDGRFVQDKLTEIIQGQGVDVTTESYSLNWLGKSYARLLANLPAETLLTEDEAHNQEEKNKNSENLFIEGDNIEVLKHMVNAYSEKVKVIYIDPPYNTGSDNFVYQDDRKFTPEQLSELAGIDLDEAERILSFTAKGSNSHSAWLTFMYPRLYVARELLSNDGVIFISIDDNELAQLKLICDEIFGEECFVECICWNKRIPKNDKGIGNIHEYILLYVKDSSLRHEFLMLKEGLDDIQILLKQLKSNGISTPEAEQEVRKLYKKNDYDRGITLYNSLDDNYRLWGKINMSWPNQDTFGPNYEVFHPKTGKSVKIPDRGWRWKLDTFNEAAKIINNEYSDIKELHDGSFICGRIWFSANENIQPSSVRYLEEVNKFLLRSILSTKSDGGVELEKLLDGKSYFSRPKPTTLIKILISSVQNSEEAVVLDFFSGSATTAHAVMELNAEDGGNRKFIMVQIPELIPKNKPAYKAGYRFVSEVSKERIHRAAKKIQEEYPEFKGDLGFKIFSTIPDFRADADAELSLGNKTFFDDAVLSDEQYLALLTTWRVYDGSLLTSLVVDISLDGYQAHLCDSRLYFIAPGFHSEALTTLLKLLDEDKSFVPNKIVLYGSNFDSSKQLEINDALKNYANKKSIELDLIVRY